MRGLRRFTEIAQAGHQVLGDLVDQTLDHLALPGSWRRDPILRGVMAEMLARPATWAYRGMESQFLIRSERLMVRGNPESVCAVLDPYNNSSSKGVTRAVAASSLPHPGLNVMLTVPTAYFDGESESVLVRFRLGKALDLGGRLYRDVRSAHTNAAYITIPKSSAVPVQVIPASALPTLRELMTVENELFAARFMLQQSVQGNSPIAPRSTRYREVLARNDALESKARPLRIAIDQAAKAESMRLVIHRER